MKRLLLCAVAVIGMFASLPARAQSAEEVVYSAVDKVSVVIDQLTITGVVQGQTTATTADYNFNWYGEKGVDMAAAQNCLRLATMAIVKPGAFLFTIGRTQSPFGWRPSCALSRASL